MAPLQLFLQPIAIQNSLARDRNPPKAFGKMMTCGCRHTGMFDGGEPDFGIGRNRARGVVKDSVGRFGRARGEDEVERVAAENSSEPFPGFAQGGVRPCAYAMGARRIADEPLRGIQPRLPGGGMERRRGVVVKVEHGLTARAGADEITEQFGEMRVAVVEALGMELDGLQKRQLRRVL